MSTSKFNLEDIPQEILDILEEGDSFEFESLIDPNTPELLTVTKEMYDNDKLKSAKKLVAHRKYVQEMTILYKKYEDGKLDQDKAETLMQNARVRYHSSFM